jgi:voltage-gated potassium channel
MTADPYQNLPPATRRRIVAWAVLRCLLSATVLVVLYYVLPFDERFGAGAVTRVLIGLVAFAVIMVWQVRSIVGSPYPGVKAIEALALSFPFFLLLFASTYFAMERASAGSFTQPMTRTDALYFTVTVFSTVGFGDITPKSEIARIVLTVQMLGDLALVAAGIRILLKAVERGRYRRSAAEDVTQPPG